MAKLCQHCRKHPAEHSWTFRPCSLGRKLAIWLCRRCDIAMNRNILKFIHHPRTAAIIAKYARRP